MSNLQSDWGSEVLPHITCLGEGFYAKTPEACCLRVLNGHLKNQLEDIDMHRLRANTEARGMSAARTAGNHNMSTYFLKIIANVPYRFSSGPTKFPSHQG